MSLLWLSWWWKCWWFHRKIKQIK